MSSTNKTTHYELSQYVGSDKPTYLVDYNQDMSAIDTAIYAAKEEADVNSGAIGTLSNLTTTVKTDLVNAVNEVNSYTGSIGNLSDLTTTSKTSCVSAINEVNGKANDVGNIANLTTTVKTDLVSAANEINANVGTLANLTTTAKTSCVAAINELDTDIGTNSSAIGTLSSLETTTKTDLVSAINEVNTLIEELDNYSLTEADTGKHWIDGSRIYRKVVPFTLQSGANDQNVAHGISNLGVVLSITGIGINSSSATPEYYSIPDFYRNMSPDFAITVYRVDATNIVLSYGANKGNSGDTGYIILEYTKTA